MACLTIRTILFFQEAKEGLYYDMWKNLKAVGEDKSLVGSVDEGIQRVIDTDYAFVDGSTLSLKLAMAANGWTKFHLASRGFYSQFCGVVLRKGSPLEPLINKRYVLCHIYISGPKGLLVSSWKRHIWRQMQAGRENIQKLNCQIPIR